MSKHSIAAAWTSALADGRTVASSATRALEEHSKRRPRFAVMRGQTEHEVAYVDVASPETEASAVPVLRFQPAAKDVGLTTDEIQRLIGWCQDTFLATVAR